MLILKTNDGGVVHFEDYEAMQSVYLKTLFYNNDDDFMNGENKIQTEHVVIEKANKKLLTIVKQLCGYILKYNIDDKFISNINDFEEEIPEDIKKCIDFTEHFTQAEFFVLLDIINFMYIEPVLQILKKKLNYIIKTETIEDIMEIFKLKESDFTKKEKDAISLYEDMLEH